MLQELPVRPNVDGYHGADSTELERGLVFVGAVAAFITAAVVANYSAHESPASQTPDAVFTQRYTETGACLDGTIFDKDSGATVTVANARMTVLRAPISQAVETVFGSSVPNTLVFVVDSASDGATSIEAEPETASYLDAVCS